jgi:hypothetical protein
MEPFYSLCNPLSTKPPGPSPTTIEDFAQFALFSQLPVELRLKIWEQGLVVERVLTFRTHFDFCNDWTEEILYFEGRERSLSLFPCRESAMVLSKVQTFSCSSQRHMECWNRTFFIDGSRDIFYIRKLCSKLDIAVLHCTLATGIIPPTRTRIKTLAIDFRTDSFDEIEALASVPYFLRDLEVIMVVVGNVDGSVTQTKSLFELKITHINKSGRMALDWCDLRKEYGRVCKVPSRDIRESVLEVLLSLVRSFTYFKQLHPDWKMPEIKFMGVRRWKEQGT